jgi:hypothetical protein
MTPARVELAALVANQRKRIEALRALAIERGLPTDIPDELLRRVAELEREIA